MEDMRDSTAQIVKVMRMVLKWHPLLTLTNLIFQLIFLQDWIEDEMSNQWKALKVHCQSTKTTLLDPLIEKMKNLSKTLQMHLDKEVANGHVKAKLIGQLALFSATFFLLKTELCSKYDKRGVKTQFLLVTGLDLLGRSKLWSQLRILHGRCGCITNSTSNFTFFILALLFSKFYDNSLKILSSMLCMTIFLLCLLVVLRPRTDLGLFNFIIGVIGSITYNNFKFKFPTWIIASICFVLFSFKSWLDKYWLDLKEEQSLASTDTTGGGCNGIFIFSSGAVRIVGGIYISSAVKSPLLDYKIWLVKTISAVLWSIRFHKIYPKDSSLPSTNTKQITNLLLIIVNIAQGIFAFTLTIFTVADYKDWLFAGIGYVIFCFWLHNFFPKDLSPTFSSTNTKGIIGKILNLQSVAKYGIVVLAGLEPRLYYRDWVATITCYVLWWVRLGMSFSKDLLLSTTTIEFKALQWGTAVFITVSDYVTVYFLNQTV